MRRFIVIGFIAFGILSASNNLLFAEEPKTLEELLIEKGTITKEEAASVQETKLAKWVDRLSFAGDLRLRHDSTIREAPNRDRHRQRLRLRLGSTLKIDNFLVGIQLASGDGSQTSNNQSFDNLFSQKPIWIRQAYLQWKAAPWLALTGGKMPNPFFRVTELVWDDDLAPEGFAQNVTFQVTDMIALFINAGQLVLDEDATDNNDQWLFAEQVGTRIGLGKDTSVTLAGAFYNFKNATEGSFGQVVAPQDGNTRVPVATGTPTALVNNYRVLNITAEFGIKVADLPLVLYGDYIKNLADTTTDQDTGYQAGLQIGKASNPRTWEVAYFYRITETDATVADIADSDFGPNGGTNHRGHVIWIGYSPTKALQLKAKYVVTEVEDETLPPGEDDTKRLFLDVVVKF
ncbi:MAG: putative porin [Candidatus Manganitrophus sp. SB1]|nr:putative porin [Candidatus Manganitrophus morganii]